MDMSSIGPSLWLAAQAITVQQVALYALVGLAASAALFVFIKCVAPEAVHIARNAANRVVACITPSPSARSPSGVGRRVNNGIEKMSLLIELCNLADSAAQDDSEGDAQASQSSSVRDMLPMLQVLLLPSIDRQDAYGPVFVHVPTANNCAYYALAATLIWHKRVPAGLSNDFFSLAAELRQKVAEQDVSDLNANQMDLLNQQVFGWLDAWLKKQLEYALSSGETPQENVKQICYGWRGLMSNHPFAQRLTQLVEPLIRTPALGQQKTGFTSRELEELVGEHREIVRQKYLSEVGKYSIFAGVFELSLLSDSLGIPLVIQLEAGSKLEFHCADLASGAPRVVIRANAAHKHFDMSMSSRA